MPANNTNDFLKNFRRALRECGYVTNASCVPGSRVYLGKGCFILNRMMELFRSGHLQAGFSEIRLPNLLSRHDVEKLDAITPISHKYFRISETVVASAAHEAAFFSYASDLLRRGGGDMSLNVFNLGEAYRERKKSPSPFNFGERVCFMEMYCIGRSRVSIDRWISLSFDIIHDILLNRMSMPCIVVDRPRDGNLPFSDKTISFDCILPIGRTFSCGMLYDQGDIFSKIFLGGDSEYASAHSAITDNAIISFLACTFFDDGFDIPSEFAAVQLAVLYDVAANTLAPIAESIAQYCGARAIRCVVRAVRGVCEQSEKEIYSGVRVSLGIYTDKFGDVVIMKYARGSRERITLSDALNIGFHDLDAATKRRIKGRQDHIVAACDSLNEVDDAIHSGHVAAISLRATGALASIKLRTGELIGLYKDADDNNMCLFARRV